MKNIALYPESLVGQKKLQTLANRASLIWEMPIAGEIAEVGVYKGGSARLLCDLFPSRPVHLFDTFTGIPFRGEGDVHDVGDFSDTSPEAVREALASHPNAVFHVGLFPATAQGSEDVEFAFVHVDGDQYQTTLDSLEFFYPRLAEGGIMIFDDYDWPRCPGVAQAIFDFLEDKPEGIQIAGPLQAFFQKGQRGDALRRLPYPQAAKLYPIDSMGANYTKAHEVQVLMWLASQTQGGIVEIGASTGNTTRLLAKTFPSRIVYGVNGLSKSHMPSEQAGEVPLPVDFCRLSRHMENVLLICSDGGFLNYEVLNDVGFIFIDGNHSYEGVRSETQRALDYLQARGGGILAWHDAFPDQPAWAGVWKFLSELSDAGLPIQLVDKTWVAYTIIGGQSDHK